MKTLAKPLVCSALTFLTLSVFGFVHVHVLEENFRHSELQVLNSRVQQQANAIASALFRVEAPLFTICDTLVVHRGNFRDFDVYAEHLLRNNPLVAALFLVPGGVVEKAYPLRGNEAVIGHNILQDPERRIEVQEAIETNSVVLAGPVNMRQGGVGFFARKPVFWSENGARRFWGLVVARIGWDTLMEEFGFRRLEAEGYAYRLSRKLRTDQNTTVIATSSMPLREDYRVTTRLPIPGGEWELAVSSTKDLLGWKIYAAHAVVVSVASTMSLLVFFLLRARNRVLERTAEVSRGNQVLEAEIASRVQAQESLRQAKDDAEAATKAKSYFLATMSHEIRTPMTGVHGMLQLLETTTLDAEQLEYVRTGARALGALLDLINDILDLSKIEAGKIDMADVAFDLAELCSSSVEVFRAQAASKGLQLGIFFAAAPGLVRGDPVRIRQILVNLVGNALKFTERGEVAVRIAMEADEAGAGWLRLRGEVADTGSGIPSDQLEGLFEPFRQVSDSYVRVRKGTGLGLAIVRRLTELMGGSVTISSRLGEGTTVRFHLRVRISESSLSSSSPAGGTQPSSPHLGLKVLIAEDDLVTQTMMSSFLRKLGCTATCVDNGRDVLPRLKEQDVDLVLMDIQMPVMDGVEATLQIRQDAELGRKSQVPVVAVTAFAMSGDREKFLAAGMDDYIAKPVDMRILATTIERVVRKQS